MKDRLTPATDPDAVPMPATWDAWTPEAVERAMPRLLNLAQIVGRIVARVEAEHTDTADQNAA